ncbi:MAG: hypothetical protein IT460_09920 [Planctomycetes bacterium]|nr:hypothetical protein [Planctomycetota bacterium]
MYACIVAGILALVFAVPLALVSLPPRLLAWPWWADAAWWLASPLLYVTLYVLVAGLLSRPFQKAIVPGRFPRDLGNPLYRARRLYGLCWTAVYYFTPLYFVCLSLPPLKRLLFRLFGYRGTMKFTVYPDTWIRDLPLLEFGEGAYVSNRATIGTNVARADGTLQVDRIRIGPRALVGHLSMVAFGTVLEEGAEVGVGCAVGSRCTLKKGAELAPCCAMGHLAELGEGASVSFMSWVGAGSVVGPGVRMPPLTQIPNRAKIRDQAAADALLSSALGTLPALAARLSPHLVPAAAVPAVAVADGGAPPSGAAPAASRPPEAPRPGAADASGARPAERWNAFE